MANTSIYNLPVVGFGIYKRGSQIETQAGVQQGRRGGGVA